MTSHIGRLYSLALALVIFFGLWVGIAARPWASAGADPAVAALVVREKQLRQDSVIVKKIVARRWSVYRVQLARRKVAIATAHKRQLAAAEARKSIASAAPSASPSVRIVTLPPLTITRSS